MIFQKQRLAITGTAGIFNLDVTNFAAPDYVQIVGSSNPLTINNPFQIVFTGTPSDGLQLWFTWTPLVMSVGSGPSIQIGSVVISDAVYLNNNGYLWMQWDATSGLWNYYLVPDFFNVHTLDGAALASATVALTALQHITAGDLIIGNAGGVPTATVMSGDATINSTGVITIADDAVTNDKLADMPVNTIKMGGANTEPVDVVMSGDGTLDYFGVLRINNGVITPQMLSSTIGGVFVATINLSVAQILALNTTSQLFIPSPGIGKTLQVIAANAVVNYAGSAYSGSTTLKLFTSTANADQASCDCLGTTVSKGFSFTLDTVGGSSYDLVPNAGIYVTATSSNPTGGTSTVTVTVFYTIF